MKNIKEIIVKEAVLFAGLFLFMNSTNTFASTYSLEKITVKGAEESESKLDTSLSVGVVHKEKLKESVPATVTESLTEVPGVSLTSPAGTLFQNPVVRGLGGKRIVMLQDGHLLTSEKTVGVTGYFLEMSDIDRIEVTKGPGSVLYGSGALSGIINVYTQDPIDISGIQSLYNFQFDDKGDSSTNVFSSAYGNKKYGVKVIARRREAKNYHTASGEEVVNSHFQDQSFTAKASYRINSKQKIKFYLTSYDGDDIGKARTPEDDQGYQLKRVYFPYDKHKIYNMQYELKNLGFFSKITAYGQFRESEQEQRIDQYTTVDTSLPDYYTSKISNNNHFSGKMIGDLHIGSSSLISFGADYNYKKLNMTEDKFDWLSNPMDPSDISLSHVSDAVPYDGATRRTFGVFETSEHFINSQNVISTGLRFDSVTTKYPYEDGSISSAVNKSFSGNIGYLYSRGKGFNFTANIGRAFRAPEIREKFMDQRTCKGLFFGNADLKPETSLNFDLGIKGELARSNYEAYVYTNYVSDFIGVVPYEGQVRPYGYWDYGYRYVNISKARLIGGELSLSQRVPLGPKGLWLKVSNQFSYVNGRDVNKNEDLAQIPPFENTTKFRVYQMNYKLLEKAFIETSVRYIAKKEKVNSSDTTFTPVTDQKTPGVTIYGLRFGFKTKKAFNRYSMDSFFSIGNITNKVFRYFLDPIESAGRNFKLGLTMNF